MSHRKPAERIVEKHVLWSIGAGLVPIPLLDIAAVSGIQLDMLKQLATLYEVTYTEQEGKVWVTALTGSLAARLAANVLKLVPGIGSILGGISMSVMSGASTWALGQVAIEQLEAHGTFLGMDLDSAKQAYDEAFEKGKKVVSEMKDKKDESKDVFEKLEKLGALRDKGIISEEDFQTKKQQLLEAL